jgi:hypothetical protein
MHQCNTASRLSLRPLLALCLLVLFVLSGCGGFTYGYFSRPYPANLQPDDSTPHTTAELVEMSSIALPGFQFHVDLNNALQTSYSEWFGFVVPVYVDPKEKWDSGIKKDERYFITVVFSSKIEGLSFNPYRVNLSVDGKMNEPRSAAFVTYDKQHNRSSEHLNDAAAPMPVKSYNRIDIYYDIDRPMPDQDIQLDISMAVFSPEPLSLPLIKFKKARWSRYLIYTK